MYLSNEELTQLDTIYNSFNILISKKMFSIYLIIYTHIRLLYYLNKKSYIY